MGQPCWERNWTGGGRADKKSTALSRQDLMGGCDALKQLKDKQGRGLCLRSFGVFGQRGCYAGGDGEAHGREMRSLD